MWTLYKKEINGFLTSLIGYITIFVFLVLNGLSLWIINSSINIFDSSLATLEGLFFISPLLFLLLISAITMKMFAEEKKNSTIEILLTKPINDINIILSKFLAALTIVLLSVLPTMIYMICIYKLATPVGNIDIGGILGSYIGLIFLGSVFCSIGIFASSLTKNQIVAFILSIIICIIVYIGFYVISYIPLLSNFDLLIQSFGLSFHYDSISRGVIDTRDLIYFISATAIFILLTKISLQSRLWDKNFYRKDIKRSHIIQLIVGFAILILVNVFGNYVFTKVDLTQEKRYSLSDTSKYLLKGGKIGERKVNDVIMVRCYLYGDNLPVNYKRLSRATKDLLDEFRRLNHNIEYELIDPNKTDNEEDRRIVYNKLFDRGIVPLQIMNEKQGQMIQQYIFPFIEVTYGNSTMVRSLINTQSGITEEEIINNSIQNIEYTLYTAIKGVNSDPNLRKKVAFLRGQNEVDLSYLLDIYNGISENYIFDTVNINEKIDALVERRYDTIDDTKISFRNKYECLIIAQPKSTFSMKDLYIIDQYIMHGGKVLFLVDALTATMDSLQSQSKTMAISNITGIEELLFAYGIRINNDLVMDLQCAKLPIITGEYASGKPQYTYYPWNFFPVVSPNTDNIITAKLNPLKFDFISSIDTIASNSQTTTEVLLTSSDNTRLLNAPVEVSLQMLKQKQEPKLFNQGKKILAVLSEGNFTSAFMNRLPIEMTENPIIANKNSSDSTSIIVVADGDIIKNKFLQGQPIPLNIDYYTKAIYGNKEFLINCINYLCGDEDLIPLRTREVIVRKLDAAKVDRTKTQWQLFNMITPILIISLLGLVIIIVRVKKNVIKK